MGHRRALDAIGVIVESSLESLWTKGTLQTGADVYNPRRMFQKVVLLTPYKRDLMLQETLTPLGMEVRVHGGRLSRPWTIPLAILRILKVLKAERVNAIRCSNIYFGCILGSISARLADIPSFAWVGGDNRLSQTLNRGYYYRFRILSNILERVAIFLVGTIFVPNNFTRQYVCRISKDRGASKVRVVPWISRRVEARSPQLSALSSVAESMPKDDFVVVILGLINRYKFSNVLFEMLQSWAFEENNPRTRFVFCGDGPLAGEGRLMFANRSQIQFTGFLPPTEVDSMLLRADLVLIPMSGLVLLEAASLGKTVIAGDVEWHGEMIENTVNGLLVNPESPTEWKLSIQDLTNNRNKALKFGQNLRSTFEERFAPERVSLEWERHLSRLVSEG